jgi:hypothetical protein
MDHKIMPMTRRDLFTAAAAAAVVASIAVVLDDEEQNNRKVAVSQPSFPQRLEVNLSEMLFIDLAKAPNGEEPVAVFREPGTKNFAYQTRNEFLRMAAPGRTGADALRFAAEGGGRNKMIESVNISVPAKAFIKHDQEKSALPAYAALKQRELEKDAVIRNSTHCDPAIQFCLTK